MPNLTLAMISDIWKQLNEMAILRSHMSKTVPNDTMEC